MSMVQMDVLKPVDLLSTIRVTRQNLDQYITHTRLFHPASHVFMEHIGLHVSKSTQQVTYGRIILADKDLEFTQRDIPYDTLLDVW